MWIESHQELGRHPKTRKLARMLGVSIPTAIGHLHLLWWWAVDYAPDGALGRFDPADIADATMWEGDPAQLVTALRDAGWLDDTDGGPQIHDWADYAGRLLERRRADTARKRSTRHHPVRRTSAGHPPDIRRTSAGHPADGACNSTIPYHTIPDHTIPTTSPDGDGDGRFAEFWQTYPKKIGKKAAQAAWRRLRPDDELCGRILAAIARARTTAQWQRDGGRYIPHPATWLTQGRWGDEFEEVTTDATDSGYSGGGQLTGFSTTASWMSADDTG